MLVVNVLRVSEGPMIQIRFDKTEMDDDDDDDDAVGSLRRLLSHLFRKCRRAWDCETLSMLSSSLHSTWFTQLQHNSSTLQSVAI